MSLGWALCSQVEAKIADVTGFSQVEAKITGVAVVGVVLAAGSVSS